MKFARHLVLAGAASMLLSTLVASPAAAAAATVSAFSSINIRPTTTTVGASSWTVDAARNEVESFQLSVRAAGGAATLSDVSASNLSGPGGTISASQISVFREAFLRTEVQSDSEGGVGLWPDALIPKKDAMYGQARGAFPVEVPDARRQGVWVDVRYPRIRLRAPIPAP